MEGAKKCRKGKEGKKDITKQDNLSADPHVIRSTSTYFKLCFKIHYKEQGRRRRRRRERGRRERKRRKRDEGRGGIEGRRGEREGERRRRKKGEIL